MPPRAETRRSIEIAVDPELRSLIPPLRPEERQQLEANLIAEGCRDPLVVWRKNGVLLDGHNRYEICTEHDIPFDTTEIDLPDRETAADWVDANQLGRRNLTPDQYSLLRGRRYNRAKKGHGGERRPSGQNVHLPKTAQRLADQHGVDEKTIRRDGQFADAVEKVKEVDPDIEKKVVTAKAPPKGAVVEAAKVLAKGNATAKEVKSTPLIPSRKDREAAEILEKAKDKAEAILSGKKGTVAQVKREVAREEKRAELETRAAAVESTPSVATPKADQWEIIEGDCIARMASMAEGCARLVFADPPYNQGMDYGSGAKADRLSDREFLDWSERWMRAAARLLAPDGSMWVMISDEYADHFGVILKSIGLHRRSWIKWYESFGINCQNNFNRCSRHIFYMVRDPKGFVFNPDAVSRPSDRQAKYGDKRADPGGKLWDNVWGVNPAIPRLVENAKERLPDFPTQLPLDLLKAVVGCASEPGDLIVDPFNGSGTTGEAAIRLGRRYLGVEQSSNFARLARLRLTAAKGECGGA